MIATGYQFGGFRFDRVAYQVARGPALLNLTPKLLDLLLYFLERPATLVTKEELLDAVTACGGFEVVDAATLEGPIDPEWIEALGKQERDYIRRPWRATRLGDVIFNQWD